MEQKDSLREATNIPGISTAIIRKLKSRRSKSSVSCTFEIFVNHAISEGQNDHLVIGMNLRAHELVTTLSVDTFPESLQTDKRLEVGKMK